MKNTMRKAMLSTIAMLVVAVMSLTGVTYAWFTASTKATVSGMEVNIGTAGAGLQIADIGATSWSGTLDLSKSAATVNTANADKILIPVSTINAENFYTATVNANATDTIVKSTAATADNYLVYNFRMKNTGNGDITVALKNITFTNAAGGANASAAVRVAILQTTAVGSMTTTGGSASLATAGLKFIYGDDASYLGLKGEGTNFKVDDSTNAALGTVTKYQTTASACQFVVPGMTDANAEQEATYALVICIEGQDTQCKNDIALSSFTVNLDFEVVE